MNHPDLLLWLAAFVLALSFTIPALSFAPWVPSRKRDMERIFTLADLKPGETFYDLGCGDGRMVLAAAKCGAKAVGIELSPVLFAIAKLRALTTRSPAEFRCENLFRTDIRSADVIYCFGVPKTLGQKLQAKLRGEAGPGTRVISYAFPIGDLTPYRIERERLADTPLFLYRL